MSYSSGFALLSSLFTNWCWYFQLAFNFNSFGPPTYINLLVAMKAFGVSTPPDSLWKTFLNWNKKHFLHFLEKNEDFCLKFYLKMPGNLLFQIPYVDFFLKNIPNMKKLTKNISSIFQAFKVEIYYLNTYNIFLLYIV